MRGASSKALESKASREVLQKEVWFVVFIGSAACYQFHQGYVAKPSPEHKFQEWSQFTFWIMFIIGLLRGYGLLRRVWSPARQSIVRYSAVLTCLEVLMHVYVGQFTASRCTIFAHTSLDYALSNYDFDQNDATWEPLSGFDETYSECDEKMQSLNLQAVWNATSAPSPKATPSGTSCTKCPMCWRDFYIGRTAPVGVGGRDVPDLAANIHLWWMIAFSLTPTWSLFAVAFKLLAFFSFPLLDWMRGTLSGVTCADGLADTHEIFRDLLLIYIVPLLATAFLIQQRKLVLDTSALAFELLQLQEDNVINEKLLRCSAEFQCEQLCSKEKSGRPSEILSYLGEDSPPSGSSPPLEIKQRGSARGYPTRAAPNRLRVPSSTKSAPTIVTLQKQVASPSSIGCKNVGADCLPADAVAWVEHQPLPLPLSEINVGDRVLCYDHLAQGPRYADVSGVSLETSVAEWVEVELEDGSRLGMTSDHPCHQATKSGEVVCASELHPGVDKLMVLKMVPVLVKSVTSMDVDSGLPQSETQGHSHARVALTVQSPSRNSVFVASSGQVPTMAVGSVDAPFLNNNKVIVKNTFLEVAEDNVKLFRSHSDPCMAGVSNLQMFKGPCEDSKLKSTQCSGTSSSSGMQDSAPSNCSSLKTSLGSALDDPDQERHWRSVQVQDEALDVVASFNTFFSALRSGFLSQGSRTHASGKCRPCVFDLKHKHSERLPGCRNGVLCPYCHDPHVRQRKRGGQKPKKMEQIADAAAQGCDCPIADDMLTEVKVAL